MWNLIKLTLENIFFSTNIFFKTTIAGLYDRN